MSWNKANNALNFLHKKVKSTRQVMGDINIHSFDQARKMFYLWAPYHQPPDIVDVNEYGYVYAVWKGKMGMTFFENDFGEVCLFGPRDKFFKTNLAKYRMNV